LIPAPAGQLAYKGHHLHHGPQAGTLGVLAVGRYVSEAWFGRKLARDPPTDRTVRNLPARPLAGPSPLLRHGQPEPVRQARHGRTRAAGVALIVTGTVLLLAVSSPLAFLNVKLLGLIMIVAGLVKARAPQRASIWLWQNRRKVIAARATLDTLREASAPVARPAGRRAAHAQPRRQPGARGGQRLERRRHDVRAGTDQLAGGLLTVTVIVPAHNEEDGIRDTLDALMQQTDRPERIIVVDDCSQDNTGPVAREYGVEVLRPPHNLGSKAKAQNYALPCCATDLVLAVDADTTLAADYVERIKRPFEDPRVVIAAGNVQTKVTRTVTERGRSIEYLYGFHFYRPIQNRAGAPVVCSGCCSAFRREVLVASGGFPERTIVEDFDWTASQQIAGNKAVYVAAAEAWAADPETIRYLRRQMNRWMSGFFQNMRIHFWPAWRHKPVLAFWYSVAIAEILMLPLWWGGPLLWVYVWHDPFVRTFEWWLAVQLAINIPVLMYAAVRRRVNPLSVLVNFPLVYVNGAVNSFYAWKGMIVELVLVPLGIARGLTVYEKGR
jgi:glycosyltransferase involved in cell wall biosynthesis